MKETLQLHRSNYATIISQSDLRTTIIFLSNLTWCDHEKCIYMV